jgi:hypothetical protein
MKRGQHCHSYNALDFIHAHQNIIGNQRTHVLKCIVSKDSSLVRHPLQNLCSCNVFLQHFVVVSTRYLTVTLVLQVLVCVCIYMNISRSYI